MPENILKVVNELRKKYKDDYIIQEGIVLDREYLIENGYLPADLKHSKKYYPIYIPGKHPIFGKNKVQYITDYDLTNPNSDLYNSYNYFEVGTAMYEDTPIPPFSKVRVFYNKASNKLYATMYFEVISFTEKSNIVGDNISVSNENYISTFNITSQSSVCSFSGGQTRRGFFTPFSTMFSQVIGKIILLREDELALNMYAVAGQESSWYSGARGDKGGVSYGFFQLNTGVHTEPFIKEYIQTGLNYLNIKDQPNIKVEDLSLTYNVKEWQLSVGYVNSSNTTYPIRRETDVNYDVQLLAWLGYMKKEKYADRLSSIPVHQDIERYQKAQRFVKSLISDYQSNTKKYYNQHKPNRDKKLGLELASKNNLLMNPTKFTSSDDKYIISYYS